MPENKQTNGNEEKVGDKKKKDADAGMQRIFIGGIVLLLVLLVFTFAQSTGRIPFFTQNFLSLVILVIIAIQAYIYHRQREVMEKQWGAMKDGLRQTDKSIESAERNSIYAQRAYVVAKIRDTGPYDDHLQFRLKIQNTGNTPANDVRISYRFEIREKPPHEEWPDGMVAYDIGFTETEWLGLIAPNGSYHVISTMPPIPLQMPITSEGYKRWESGTDKFYCWGRIIYEDIFNEGRHTDFCFFQSQQKPNGYPCKHGNSAI